MINDFQGSFKLGKENELPFRFVFFRPPHPSGKTFQFKHVLLAFIRAKLESRSIGLHKHFPGARLDLFTAE
jgi:hypothetical protein